MLVVEQRYNWSAMSQPKEVAQVVIPKGGYGEQLMLAVIKAELLLKQ
jgi:hypothetical protein